ncbi:MAG: 2-hydroxyacid dehydrogenase [Acidiferrobacterales bacterium]
MPTLLFKSDVDSADAWRTGLQTLMPDLEVRVWPELGKPTDIEYALVWKPLGEALRGLPNLRAIFSLGAGVDHLLGDPGLPPGVPIVRMIDPALTEGMCEYVLLHVLRYHRKMPEYEVLQHQRRWHPLRQIRPSERQLGVMGLGVLGSEVARRLASLDFAVAGWARSPKQIEEIETFHGLEQLKAFLARTQILICVLALTPMTEGILNKDAFAALPRGAYLINVARGAHLVEQDLLAALDDGSMAGATLDVFQTEPLSKRHPFWGHPHVTVTPHIASLTNPYTAAAHVIDNIQCLEHGEPLTHVVDLEQGY